MISRILIRRFFKDLNFRAGFRRKMGVAATRAPKGMSPQKPTKIWPTGDWLDRLDHLF